VGVTVHTGVLQIALVDHSGGIISLTNEKIDPPDPYHLARLVDQRIHELAVEHRLLTTRFLGVGLSVPGPTLSRNGNRWHIVPDLPGWRNVPLREIMDQTLGMPVWIENDATAAALAEYYLGGLMARCSTAIVILLGYGIGAGIIDDGRLFKGEIGNAGEVGRLFPSDRPRPSTVDLLSTLRSAGCDVASIVDFEQKTRGYEEVIEQWTIRAAQQLRGAIKSASAWFDPGVIRLSSPLPAWLIRRLSEILNDRPVDMKKSGVEFDFDAVEYSTDVSDLGGASSTLGAALLPIHALIGRYS
jgi:predicted NBD/HSP70 family sugar kinase